MAMATTTAVPATGCHVTIVRSLPLAPVKRGHSVVRNADWKNALE